VNSLVVKGDHNVPWSDESEQLFLCRLFMNLLRSTSREIRRVCREMKAEIRDISVSNV